MGFWRKKASEWLLRRRLKLFMSRHLECLRVADRAVVYFRRLIQTWENGGVTVCAGSEPFCFLSPFFPLVWASSRPVLIMCTVFLYQTSRVCLTQPARHDTRGFVKNLRKSVSRKNKKAESSKEVKEEVKKDEVVEEVKEMKEVVSPNVEEPQKEAAPEAAPESAPEASAPMVEDKTEDDSAAPEESEKEEAPVFEDDMTASSKAQAESYTCCGINCS